MATLPICDNGHKLGKGKVPPCANPAPHVVCQLDAAGNLVKDSTAINLCDEHFELVMRLGLITKPFLECFYDKEPKP